MDSVENWMWLGVVAPEKSHIYKMLNGKDPAYLPWNPQYNEPNGVNEQCTSTRYIKRMVDVACQGQQESGLCQRISCKWWCHLRGL